MSSFKTESSSFNINVIILKIMLILKELDNHTSTGKIIIIDFTTIIKHNVKN